MATDPKAPPEEQDLIEMAATILIEVGQSQFEKAFKCWYGVAQGTC